MNDIFTGLNNVTIDFDDYENTELTEMEKWQLKKRIKKKLKTRPTASLKTMAATAAVLALLVFGSVGIANNTSVLANVPLIGAALEELIDSNRQSLDDYKVVIGKTVEDKGIEIRLNEVLLDNGRLVISSTFRSSNIDLDRVSMTPMVYINGRKILSGAHGSSQEVTNSTYISCSSIDLRDVKMDEVLKIKISYDDIFYADTGKSIHGNWDDFEFTATSTKLMAETQTTGINKRLTFDDGQEIVVKNIIISPFSTTLNYSSINGSDHISFDIEDQDGNKLRANSAHVLSKNSYNRFDEKSLENATKLIITPIKLNFETGKFQAFPDKAFDVTINNAD